MTDDDKPALVTIPTEMERGDSFVVFTVGISTLLVCWWLAQRGVHLGFILAPAIILGVWMLTHRATTDVRFVGSIAVMVRNKLGERDVHEWVLAFVHYWRLVTWPIWKFAISQFTSACQSRLLWIGRTIRQWLRCARTWALHR